MSKGHPFRVRYCDPGGRIAVLLGVARGRTIAVFDERSGQLVRTLEFATDIMDFAISADGKWVAAVSWKPRRGESSTVHLMAVDGGGRVASLGMAHATAAVFDRTGHRVLVQGDSSAKVFDWASGKATAVRGVLDVGFGGFVSGANTFCAPSTCPGKMVEVDFDIPRGRLVGIPLRGIAMGIATAPDRDAFVVHEDNILKLCNRQSGDVLWRCDISRRIGLAPMMMMQFSPDGHHIGVLTGGSEPLVIVVDSISGLVENEIANAHGLGAMLPYRGAEVYWVVKGERLDLAEGEYKEGIAVRFSAAISALMETYGGSSEA